MFTISITIPSAPQAPGTSVAVAMYGQLLAAYTPASGPSNGQSLAALEWVYFAGSDYAAATAAPASGVPAFATYASPSTSTITLPSIAIQAAHIVFGVDALPAIPVVAGAPQQPSPITAAGTYDFVEFTYNTDGVLYLNTTMIDQFGLPIGIQVDPAEAMLPSGAGVILDRETVFSQYRQYAAGTYAAYAQCADDAFGKPLSTRILSPKNALANAPQGVVTTLLSSTSSTLAAGSYYYAVTALDQDGKEGYAQPDVVTATVPGADQSVTVAWSPIGFQPAGTASFNVYRGIPAGNAVTWTLLGNVAAAGAGVGGAFADTGQPGTPGTGPRMNPLVTYFDSEIQAFFARYEKKKETLVLTATDGTTNGYVYAFHGTTTTDAAGSKCLQLTLKGVTSAATTPPASPIPLGTPFNIYYPYWNTNTYDSGNPAPPPWTLYPNATASTMVLAAEGVFADNAQQVASNLPPGVTATAAYSTLLGGLENQIVAAITRGIANSATISPQNWGNGTAPVQLPPTLKGSLTPGTTYYYVVTATNANGESIASFEFNATPTAEQRVVQVNWQSLSTTVATAFNVYRGTASQQQDVLVAQVPNTGTTSSFIDTGEAGTAQRPPMYFPAGVPWSAYDAFFHQPYVSMNGAAYAGPYDDQGGQSSTLSATDPVSATIALGAWTPPL